MAKGQESSKPLAHNHLSAETRSAMVELLDARLADAVDLPTRMRQAHWNAKGPNFTSLHELFDQVTEDVEEHVDLVVELAIQLGGVVHRAARQAGARSTASEDPAVRDDHRHVEAVTGVLAAFGKVVRSPVDRADGARDKDTADIFTGISRGVDKGLWFVEAQLQAER